MGKRSSWTYIFTGAVILAIFSLAACTNISAPEDTLAASTLPKAFFDDTVISEETQELFDEANRVEEVPAWVNTVWSLDGADLEKILQDNVEGYIPGEPLTLVSENSILGSQSSALMDAINQRLIEALTAVQKEEILSQSYADQWYSLTPGEQRLCALSAIACALTKLFTDKAREYSLASGYEGEDGGRWDAYRHSFWTATMSYGLGRPWAEAFSRAHENGRKDPLSCMDYYNNWVGYVTIASELRRDYPFPVTYTNVDAEIHQYVNGSAGRSLAIFWPRSSAEHMGDASGYMFLTSGSVKSYNLVERYDVYGLRAPFPVYYFPTEPINWCNW